MNTMKVHFIVHSTFFIETKSAYLLIDYYEGELPDVKPNKPLYVLASHSHSDHFSDSVFDFANRFSEIYFILSSDIFKSRVPDSLMTKAVFISPYQKMNIGDIEVETLKSTDMGVAFLIHVDDILLYHAGDLNDWVWNEAMDFQNKQMHQSYINQMDKLKDKNIFAAFVPLDPRQEDDYNCGMLGFIENSNAEIIFPMHMWGDYSVVAKFKKQHPEFADRIMPISSENQSFDI